jgi:citrate lyase subunit gamma (acyl carrier protein)
MEIKKAVLAGTLESSDAQVTVEPGTGPLDLTIESSVMNQYGRQIKATVLAVLQRLGVTSGHIRIIDKGALDCTLKARVECAIYRSNGKADADIPWEVL